MNEPIYGCAGCQNTAGAGGCPVHRNLNANVAYDPAPRIYDYLNHQLCNDTIQRLDKEKQQLLLQNERLQNALRGMLDDAGQVGHPSTWREACLTAYKVLNKLGDGTCVCFHPDKEPVACCCSCHKRWATEKR